TLNTVMLAYNLMSLLRQVLLKTSAVKHSSKSVQHTLQTLRCWRRLNLDHLCRLNFDQGLLLT
ncbi:MAG: hypothetical protein ABIP64_12735, partial [Burkholderiales bacterium]